MEIVALFLILILLAVYAVTFGRRDRSMDRFDLPEEITRPTGPRPVQPNVRSVDSAIASQPARPVSRPQPVPDPVIRPVAQPKALTQLATGEICAPFSGKCMVIDGDTIIVKKQRIRLFGIDAPELEHPWGKKSKWTLIGLCKGKVITIEPRDHLSYDRIVAKCLLPDGTDLSAEMVRRGMAIDWPEFSGGVYLKFEPEGVRNRHWRADARQNGRMDLWSTPYEGPAADDPRPRVYQARRRQHP